MASASKRKRGHLEGAEPSKRSRSNQDVPQPAPELDFSKAGWDAAFGPNKRQNGTTNDVNGIKGRGLRDSSSPEAEDFEKSVERARISKREKRKSKTKAVQRTSAWKISDPIGGRMIELDPIFTEDEKFLIVAHRKAIQVYSTSNSLLHRSINLSIDGPQKPFVHVVDCVLSPTDPNIVWVACSNGSLYRINWVLGEGWERSWETSSNGTIHMTVASIDSAGHRRDIIFTDEKHEQGWRITAHELSFLGNSTTTQSRVVYTSTRKIQIMKALDEGAIIIAASEDRVLLGSLRSNDFGTVDKIRYEFRIFESTDVVSSLDARVSKRSSGTNSDKVKVVDVVVGDVKGAMFVHNDLLQNLIRSQKSATDNQLHINLIPRKLHWHRKAVHCVKWSLDGSYIISGGSETVLVLWQLDTGRQQYLPHLSATIQNIVVSPKGNSYALHLMDNSTMILSTSELVPTAYVAGIQAHVIGRSNSDTLVRRLEDEEGGRPFIPRTPAVINPARPETLLLAVGEVQEIKPSSSRTPSAPFLQTFNIASNHNVSRQAMTRTNITNKNIAPNVHSISEPGVTQMKISHDGMWLATVDEWLPPGHDVEFLGHSGMNLEDEQRRRREVYLKFWQWNKSDECWGLVSRIDAPHTIAHEKYGAGRVLALGEDPNSHTFSTLGEDGIVQIWQPRVRKRDGVVVRGGGGEPLHNWHCQRQVPLGTAVWDDDVAGNRQAIPSHGSLAFSEDGSVMAAAISGHEDGLVHLIDPVNGVIQSSHSLMCRGDLISLAFSAQYLIILSDELQVWDLVLNELKYGVTLGDAQSLLFSEQKAEMMHLAVDLTTHTFAIALPCSKGWKLDEKAYDDSLSSAYSEVAVFDPHLPTPVYTQRLSSLVTALVPALSSPGYIVLDAAAEISTISPKATQTLTSMAKPMVELRLDIRGASEDVPAVDLLRAADPDTGADADADADADVEIEEEPGLRVRDDNNDDGGGDGGDDDNDGGDDEDDDDNDDDGPPVVTSHQLSRVLDIGPSFALPPIEELFYAVAELFSSKPKVKAEAEAVETK